MSRGAATTAVDARRAGVPLTVTAAAMSLLVLAYCEIAGLTRAGVFEYPLDDVYIHLSIGSEIAHGGYGVNPGEFSAAASSILYPVLLAPFAGSELQRFLPLVWNALAVAGSGWLWGALLVEAGLVAERRRIGLMLAILGPVGLNIGVVGFTGMENALHGTATMALLLGLVRFVRSGTVGPLLVAGALLGPALRYEGLGLSLLAAVMVGALGRPKAGMLLAAGALAPVVAFTLFLLGEGAGPLPDSVVSKLSGEAGLAGHLLGMLGTAPGAVLAVLSLVALVLAVTLPRGDRGGQALGIVAALGGFAHLAFGRVGWMDRYEHYALLFVAGAVVWLVPRMGEGTLPKAALGICVACLGLLTVVYQGNFGARGQWAPQAIHLQQGQMARFARDLDAPVAVNDIGRVAYGNPNYVLDLWGLSSPAALSARLEGAAPGWAGPIAADRGVEVAMIYEDWVGDAVAPDWTRLGRLRLDVPAGMLGARDVAFYATRPADAARLKARLEEFSATLPPGASFQFAPEQEVADD